MEILCAHFYRSLVSFLAPLGIGLFLFLFCFVLLVVAISFFCFFFALILWHLAFGTWHFGVCFFVGGDGTPRPLLHNRREPLHIDDRLHKESLEWKATIDNHRV